MRAIREAAAGRFVSSRRREADGAAGDLLGLTAAIARAGYCFGQGDERSVSGGAVRLRSGGHRFQRAERRSGERGSRGEGAGGRVSFRAGDAERLPFADSRRSTRSSASARSARFPDKAAAAGEFARVLRRGGVAGLSDLTRGPGCCRRNWTDCWRGSRASRMRSRWRNTWDICPVRGFARGARWSRMTKRCSRW